MPSPHPELIVESDRAPSPDSIRTRPRNEASVSRVNLNYFDPEGVEDLKRSLSHDDPNADALSFISDNTVIVDDNFDFKKMLQRTVKK
jgi:ATP-binding cassette, subfamily G (WHITE), member 2, SNQ2